MGFFSDFGRTPRCDAFSGSGDPRILQKPPEETVHTRYHGSQDAAHDADTLQTHKVSHVLNVAYGVSNLFPGQLVYKTLQILDVPDTDITSYFGECGAFIDQAREEGGVVLVHCNAGVSRSSSVVIGYLMWREGLPFGDAYSQVKQARPSTRPNPGFYRQLQNYKAGSVQLCVQRLDYESN
ncbi:putative dual specificity protein phosphatase 19-like [Scophthalmus maximus]|uniref:Putative dual specificity protein phosphatase 19-like n=1 Tax=Scophthalmus maximus TaxID=52904 RepID=A0A2U9CDL0_SCOMX|nr:putative dual specificity protein phosphatase 19-like [Scophthalmus maximus]